MGKVKEEKEEILSAELEKANIELLNVESDEFSITLEVMTPEDGSAFLNIVGATFDSAPGSLYRRIARSDFDNDKYDEDIDWEYGCRPVDCNLKEKADGTYYRGKDAEFFFSIYVSFPITDLDGIIRILHKHNSQQKGAPVLVPNNTYWKN